jgi:hypothetical protein
MLTNGRSYCEHGGSYLEQIKPRSTPAHFVNDYRSLGLQWLDASGLVPITDLCHSAEHSLGRVSESSYNYQAVSQQKV